MKARAIAESSFVRNQHVDYKDKDYTYKGYQQIGLQTFTSALALCTPGLED